MMRGILKFLGILLLIVVVVGFITYLLVDEELPEGIAGDQAEMLTDEMLEAVNKPAYDSIQYIAFTFKGLHSFRWDKKNNNVTVIWDDNEVFLDLNLAPDEYNMLEFKAYKYFVNDTFWLVAPFKARDPGTVRAFVDLPEGRGLLVTYMSGGVTPGDSYLWILDDNGMPIAWKLWVNIIPVGGLKFSWDDWEERNNAFFSTFHESMILDLDITDLKVE